MIAQRWGEFEHLSGNSVEGDRKNQCQVIIIMDLKRNHAKIIHGRINLKQRGDTSESKEKKNSEVDIEIRIMFFHFVPEVNFNVELFYWEIIKFSLKIYKILIFQNKTVTYRFM